MIKLRVKFVKFEKSLAMQITDMDERFRFNIENETPSLFTHESGKIVIKSGECPNLLLKSLIPTIYLRGWNKEFDLKIATEEFYSNIERDKALDSAIESLDTWANSWIGYKDEPFHVAFLSSVSIDKKHVVTMEIQ